MSDEFDHPSDSSVYSAFWPLLIVTVGLLLWIGLQDYQLNNQRAYYKRQLAGGSQAISAAQNWQGKYASIMKDLNDSSAKDPTAAAILRQAVQAGIQSGLIRVQPNATNAAGNPAAPSATK